MILDSVFWERLDAPGHDVARLVEDGAEYRVEGTAVWFEDGVAAGVRYVVVAERDWRTRRGMLTGRVGEQVVDVEIERNEGGWLLNGELATDLEDCLDLDFGFTPATNVLAVRRMALPPGAAAEAPAAYLELPLSPLVRLQQRYERRGESTYWYESPTAGYEAMLGFRAGGFVREYPGLWRALG